MAVELTITGNGTFAGGKAALESYSYEEESTPITGEDSAGAVGQLSFSVRANSDTLLLMNDEVELTDQSNGRTRATVVGVSIQNEVASVAANSRLAKLSVERTLAPYSGTLGGALTAYLAACGVTTGFVIDSALTGRSVAFPGYVGNVWELLKQITAIHEFEISLTSSNIVFRPLRQRIAEVNRNASFSQDVQLGELARNVEVVYYQNTYKSSAMVYPKDGIWTDDLEVITVNAGEEVTVELELDVSLMSVDQPTPQAFVYKNHTGSVYAVAGNDGLPIQPAQWLAQGGSVRYEISPDNSKVLLVHVKGASEERYAPYSLSVNSGASNRYSALRVQGTGIFTYANTVTFPTGIDPALTTQEIGATIDFPHMTSYAEAASVGIRTAQRYAAATMTVNASTRVINRAGESGQVVYMTFGQHDTARAGLTFGTFDTAFAGNTFGQYDNIIIAAAQEPFESQAFGNAGGARVRAGDAWYRIRQATITQDSVEYTAEADTLLSDFDLVNAGITFTTFDTRWSGKTFADHALVPLRSS